MRFRDGRDLLEAALEMAVGRSDILTQVFLISKSPLSTTKKESEGGHLLRF